MISGKATILAAMLFLAGGRALAQVTYSTISFADTFLATGSPGNPAGTDLTGLNYGAAGALVVAPAASTVGEFQTVIEFNLSGATNLFNTNYGTNNWVITGISLELIGNFGAAGEQPFNPIFPTVSAGQFIIEWLSDDDWVEGTGTPNQPTTDGVTYNSLPDLLAGPHAIISTNTYTPPGNNVHVTYTLPLETNLVNDATQGGDVTFLLYAADNQIGYVFNSYNFGRGNEPLIHVTASAASLNILSANFTNGVFHLTGVGMAGQQYQIQATPSLAPANWQIIGTAMADSTGTIQFDDTTAADQPQRFYRLSR